MDVDNIPVGMDFRGVLEGALGRADAVLAVIGKKWLNSRTSDGDRRLDDPNDFVRMEIEYALRGAVPVIPVLVNGATMPPSEELPDSLRQLVHRLGFVLSTSSFRHDAKKLAAALRGADGPEHVNVEKRLHVVEPGKGGDPAARGWKIALLSRLAALLGVESQFRKVDLDVSGSLLMPYVHASMRSEATEHERDEVFMSYSRRDSTIMHKIRGHLAKSKISVWTDDKVVPGTPSWKKAVQSAIENSTFFMILLTPSAKESDTVEMELGYARAHSRIILPVLVEGTNRTAVPIEIINFQWTDIREEFEAGMARVVEAIFAYRTAARTGSKKGAVGLPTAH